MTLPDLDIIENCLLSAEASRWIQSDCFGNHRGRAFEAENYQLNSSVLAALIKKILTQGPPFWRDFGSSPCNLPSCIPRGRILKMIVISINNRGS